MLSKNHSSRRGFLRTAAVFGLSTAALKEIIEARAGEGETMTLPFENGERQLVVYPGKRPLLRLTSRPPQLETPFKIFNEGVFTPNDAFFVRYHLAPAPPAHDQLEAGAFKVSVRGTVNHPLSLSVSELRSQFESVETAAVNQCSGNGRGFSNPRVPGGQLGNGAMGNAKWRGVRLKDVLAKAGIAAGAKQVVFNGLDKSLLPTTPDYLKALDLDIAIGDDVLLAYEMNGEPLPWLNGFPLRLVVPGYYGTYWMKHVHEINVIDKMDESYWMSTAYRIPDNSCACVEPGTVPKKTAPIARLNVRSFITNLAAGDTVKSRVDQTVRGIAFDGGYGIKEVLFSEDGGKNWRQATLGKDHGNYSFREWTAVLNPAAPGMMDLKVMAINRIGQSQPNEALWNPAGYMRNVIETVRVNAI